MICENCGERGDWIGDDALWDTVSSGGSVLALYECTECGHRQRGR